MKIVILSDVNENCDAPRALPESCDELWVLGGLVEATVGRLRALRFPRDVEEGLVRTLRTGTDCLAIGSNDEEDVS